MLKMNRRQALHQIGALALMIAPAHGNAIQPYRASLFSGARLDGLWQAGILVELDPGWKTYWRMPGDAGIPPQFDWQGSANTRTVAVSYPVPVRFQDAGGETIGYHDKVVFPLSVTPASPDQMVGLKLKMFFAVCESVCIPATAELEVVLGVSNSNSLLASWQQRVPTAGHAVSNARVEMHDSQTSLVLGLQRPVDDIFVEADAPVYFGKPRFDITSGEAWLPLANNKGASALKNTPLRLTLSTGNTGIEQTVTVN